MRNNIHIRPAVCHIRAHTRIRIGRNHTNFKQSTLSLHVTLKKQINNTDSLTI